MVMRYVTDTHALVWHITRDPRLSSRAAAVFEQADDARCSVVIPCIVFWELTYLIEKGKLPAEVGLLVRALSDAENYVVHPLCLPVIEASTRLPREALPDPWDRLIAGTALHLRCPLLTRDAAIRQAGVEVVW
jgi:PIN domain nuclease of toxin-antitoxin system